MEFFIGRDSSCHIVLDSHKISRHHAVILFENQGAWSIKNISANSEILVNGQNAQTKPLKDNDKITIGDFELIVTELSMINIIESDDKTEFLSENDILDGAALEPNSDMSDRDTGFEIDEEPVLASENDFEAPDEELASESEVPVDNTFEDELNSDESLDPIQSESFSEDDSTKNEDAFTENAFDDGGFGFDEATENSSEKTEIFKGFAKYQLKLYGENVPYTKFLLEDNKEILIGRSVECDIVLKDSEVSSKHARLKKTLSFCILEDLNSGNGTFYKGERVNRAELVSGDEFVIGGTTFSVEVQSDLIDAESDRLMPVEENQVIETEEIVEEESHFDELGAEEPVAGGKFSLKAILADPKKKRIFYIVLVLFLVLLFVDDGSESTSTSASKKPDAKKEPLKPKKNLSREMLEQLEQSYLLARSYFSEGKYAESIAELDKIRPIDPDYKETAALYKTAKQGLQQLQEAERKKREEEERKIKMVKVKELLEKARLAVKDKQVILADELFSQIFELDPENVDVASLKLELDAYKKELAEKKEEEERRKKIRQEMISSLAPGKNAYLKKEWYKAILNLERFLNKEDLDEDLVSEASSMLKESKENLDKQVAPLIGQARSYKEGQDLKNAYQAYNTILNIEPSNSEAINEVDSIKDILDSRSKKVFREALILYDLSLYDEARDKFKEVLQVSPTNSEYYEKAAKKLKEFWNE